MFSCSASPIKLISALGLHRKAYLLTTLLTVTIAAFGPKGTLLTRSFWSVEYKLPSAIISSSEFQS